MLEEAIKFLEPKSGDIIVDATLGGGSYSLAIAKKVGPHGKVIALDLDEAAINQAKLKTAQAGLTNIKFYHANFKDLKKICAESSFPHFSGIVFDLGLSSAQLEDSARGFSFRQDAPLDMSFGSLIPARRTKQIVNTASVSELTSLLKDYGEERFALSIARSIAKARSSFPITTTKQLVAAIRQGVPAAYRHQRIHFATRTFQALRIATNDELKNLKTVLSDLRSLLSVGSRIVVVSFHSLEDRIVKQFFKTESRDCLCPPDLPVCVCDHQAWLKIITKKAIVPEAAEIMANPRARSAKLRASEVIN